MITTPSLLRRNYRGCYACLMSYTPTLSQLASCASSWTGSRHKLLGGNTGRAIGRKRSRGPDSIPQPVQDSRNYSSLRQVDTREMRRWRDAAPIANEIITENRLGILRQNWHFHKLGSTECFVKERIMHV